MFQGYRDVLDLALPVLYFAATEPDFVSIGVVRNIVKGVVDSFLRLAEIQREIADGENILRGQQYKTLNAVEPHFGLGVHTICERGKEFDLQRSGGESG